MRFAHPGWLFLLVLMALPWFWERRRGWIAWPSLSGFRRANAGLSPRTLLRRLPTLARSLAIGALVVGLARPQTVGGVVRIAAKGVAVVVALDQSSSMNARDFPADEGARRLSRLEAAKETFARFVEGRESDLVGLVVFANYPDLACPPTLDHRFLLEAAAAVRSARPGDDGTNIGDALAWSLDALRHASPPKKVLILLTDGNNEPAVPDPLDPEHAAELARDLGITLHAIAIGRAGGVVRNTEAETGRPIVAEIEGPNLPLLESLAEITGGRSFLATDADALDAIFETIDELEKSQIQDEIYTRYDERFLLWAALAFGLLAFDRLLTCGPLRRLP